MLKSFQYKKNEYNTLPLLLMLLGIDHLQEPVYRTHGIPINQLFYCKKGKGELILDNRKYVIDKGQCFIILKDIPHEYHGTTSDWTLDILGFNGNIVPLLLRTLKLDSSGAYLLSGKEIIEKHFLKLQSISEQSITKKHLIYSKELYCFLTDVAFLLTHITLGQADFGNPTITQIIDYLETNYDKDISLDELSAQVSRTPEYLCNIFKEHTGLTIVKYLNNIKLLRASILLVQEPSMPVNEISMKCGFRSASYFGKMFLAQYNSTPNQYRLKHLT